MTLQDDRARPWFQPLAPTEQPHNDFSADAGPLTTRIEGELIPPDQPLTPAPWAERLEVTQPFIPAIREQPPEFAKKLNPEPAPSDPTPEDSSVDTITSAATPTEHQTSAPASPATEKTTRTSAPATEPTAGRPKRRSLARRVVRHILGPDLLRKDPAPKKR